MPRSKSDVIEYVEIEADEEVVHAKQEQTFRDLGQTVNIWNVKTAKGAWWVIEGDYVPMNLYTQNATYLSADEAYSFHMGIMWRLLTRQTGDPESILGNVSFGEKRFASSKRKLEEAAKACSQAEEVEQLQSVGEAGEKGPSLSARTGGRGGTDRWYSRVRSGGPWSVTRMPPTGCSGGGGLCGSI
jgi:hypothetical protein